MRLLDHVVVVDSRVSNIMPTGRQQCNCTDPGRSDRHSEQRGIKIRQLMNPLQDRGGVEFKWNFTQELVIRKRFCSLAVQQVRCGVENVGSVHRIVVEAFVVASFECTKVSTRRGRDSGGRAEKFKQDMCIQLIKDNSNLWRAASSSFSLFTKSKSAIIPCAI